MTNTAFAYSYSGRDIHQKKPLKITKTLLTIILTIFGATSAMAEENLADELRANFLSLPNTEFVKPFKKEPIVGIITEETVENGTYSLVTMVDGATSLYYSTGGGVIGGGEHKEVKTVTLEYVKQAKNYLKELHEVKTFPRPKKGHVIFYFITPTKVLASDELNVKDVVEKKSKLSPLFYSAQNVLTVFRNTIENTKGSDSKIRGFEPRK